LRRNRDPRKALLINAVGFAAILMLDFQEAYLFVNIALAFFIGANMILFILWPRLRRDISFPMGLLAAAVALVTGYDYYTRGSRQVYLIWFGLGCVMLIQAFLKKRRSRQAAQT